MTPNEWRQWASSRCKPILLDGGLATTLESRGWDISGPLWSAKLLIENPAAIKKLTYDFLLAGADIVSTATYQASQHGFESTSALHADKAIAFMRSSVDLAVDARNDFWDLSKAQHSSRRKPLVALSLGPYGAILGDGSEYSGKYGIPGNLGVDLYDFHLRRAQVFFRNDFAELGSLCLPDIIAFETIPCISEAVAIVELARQRTVLKSTPFWISFQCGSSTQLASEESLWDAVAAVLNANENNEALVGIGVNCVNPDCLSRLLSDLQLAIRDFQARKCISPSSGATPDLLTIAYPNSGEAWSQNGWHWSESCILSSSWANSLVSTKADIVGGCCRCDPEYVCLKRSRQAASNDVPSPFSDM